MRKINLVLVVVFILLAGCGNDFKQRQGEAIDQIKKGDLITAEKTLKSLAKEYDDIDDISEDSIAVKQFIYAQESYNTSKDTKDLDTAKTAIARAKTPEIKKSLQQRLDDLTQQKQDSVNKQTEE